MQRHIFCVGYSSNANIGVREGERVYPPAPGRHPNPTHFLVRDVVEREVDSMEMDAKWTQKIKGGIAIRPVNMSQDNAAYEFSYPGVESWVTRPYQFTRGRFDSDRGFTVQLRKYMKAKLLCIRRRHCAFCCRRVHAIQRQQSTSRAHAHVQCS